ncbi:hypothetical protein JCM19992_00090 [Thermostilla marina]
MSTNRAATGLLLVIAIGLSIGCGGGKYSGSTQTPRAAVVELEGAESPFRLEPQNSDRIGGLVSPGDLDGDGLADVVVALRRKVPGGAFRPAEKTWIVAYSSNDRKQLWSLQGKQDTDPAVAYFLGPIAPIPDVDGDAVPDLYCREARTEGTALLISGSSGSVIGRFAVEPRKPEYEVPKRCDDRDGDGVPDLLFGKNRSSRIIVCSGKDLSVLEQQEDVWPQAQGRFEWCLAVYHDDNGDGMPDILLRRLSADSFEYAVIDGKTWNVLRTFESPRLSISGETFFVRTDDLDRDGAGDFVFACVAGGGSDGNASLLRAVSGNDGRVIWDVAGGAFGSGEKAIAVDLKSGGRTPTAPDVRFGSTVVSLPDRNGDGVADLAAYTKAGGPDADPAVLIISGATGDLLATLATEDLDGRPTLNMARLSAENASSAALAVCVELSDTFGIAFATLE